MFDVYLVVGFVYVGCVSGSRMCVLDVYLVAGCEYWMCTW